MNNREVPVVTAPSASRERLELETRVLAAALRQSLEVGDADGSSLAHEQIFLLIKACQELNLQEPQEPPREIFIDKGRQLPDIDWGTVLDDVAVPVKAVGSATPATENTDESAGSLTESADFTKTPRNGGNIGEVSASSGDVKETQAADSLNVQALPPVQSQLKSQENTADRSSTVIEKNIGTGFLPKPADPDGPADLYGRLSVEETTDTKSIHLGFLLKVRTLLRKEELFKGPERRKTLTLLQSFWIAHDILSDPVTRGDYDTRRRGARHEDDEDDDDVRPNMTLVRIGELLELTGLLEKTELEIAADMHKAMPEMMFGAFLVKQGFIAEDDLRCVLVGQALIKDAVITLEEFQKVMEVRAVTQKDIGVCLKSQGLVTDDDLRRIVEEDGPLKTLCELSGISLVKSDVGIITSEDLEVIRPVIADTPVRALNLGAAAPAWKDQLDWGLADDVKTEVEKAPESISAAAGAEEVVEVVSVAEAAEAVQSATGVSTAETPALASLSAQITEIPVAEAEQLDGDQAEFEQASSGSFFEDEAATPRKPKSSLIDLMVDIGSTKAVEVEGGDALLKFVEHQEQNSARASTAEESPDLEVTAGGDQEDFSPPLPVQAAEASFPFDVEEPDTDFFEDVAELSSAVDAILDLPDPDTDTGSASGSEPPQFVETSDSIDALTHDAFSKEFLPEEAGSKAGRSLAKAADETSSQIPAMPGIGAVQSSVGTDTAADIPSLRTNDGQLDTSSKIPVITPDMLARQANPQSSSGGQQAQDWSIVSLPASHLASFLLDDEPPSQPGQPRKKDKNDDDKPNKKRRR